MHQNLLQYRGGRYLWLAVGLLIVSVAVYWSQDNATPPNGGTWQGYTLGGLAAALCLWLAWLGIRKRSYASSAGTVQGWASAHVYLGLAVLLVALLHGAFQLGWNVHTLCFALLAAVVASGLVGLVVYLLFPQRLARVRAGKRRKDWLSELNELDAGIREVAQRCEAVTRAVAESAVDRTALGGGVLAQLRGADGSRVLDPAAGAQASRLIANRDQTTVIDYLTSVVPKADKRAEAQAFQDLLSKFARRRTVLRKLRQDIRLQAWMQIWLYLHIPLTVGLLGALAVHVVSVFIYW